MDALHQTGDGIQAERLLNTIPVLLVDQHRAAARTGDAHRHMVAVDVADEVKKVLAGIGGVHVLHSVPLQDHYNVLEHVRQGLFEKPPGPSYPSAACISS